MMEGQPNAFVYVALLLYVPIAFLCVSTLGPRRGLLAAGFGGWLFLPVFDPIGKSVPLLHSKAQLVPAVLLLVSLTLDAARWRTLRPGRRDLPVLAIVLVYPASALANGNGAYDAAAALLASSMTWAAPYLLGRVYFGTPGGAKALAQGFALAALAYVPFCLFELRLSPQLHRILYGYHQHSFLMHIRYGGYRPMVFMTSGIMVGLFMACGTLAAYCLWRSKAATRLAGLPLGAVTAGLAVITVWCKSTGAIALLAAAIAFVEVVRRFRRNGLVWALVLLAPLASGARIAGWSGQELIQASGEYVNADRADSLFGRIYNEDILTAKALQRPWLGWSSAHFQIVGEQGAPSTVSDSAWVIVLGTTGLVGLAAFWTTLLLPVVSMLRTCSVRRWAGPQAWMVAALSLVLVLFALDDLFNFMLTPPYLMAAGSLVSLRLGPSLFARRRAVPAGVGPGRGRAAGAVGPAVTPVPQLAPVPQGGTR